MPKGQPRTGSATISDTRYRKDGSVISSGTPGTNKKGTATDEQLARIRVGDDGVERAKADKKYRESTGDVTGRADTSDAQETPAQKRAKKEAALQKENDELYGKVKKALSKANGPLSRDSYKDD